MKFVQLPSGENVPALGLGTWYMGENPGNRSAEVRALQAGLDQGLTLIDTAEMYAEGGAEEVVGEAMAGRRDEVFLVSKVYPWNASSDGVPAACERSLARLGADVIDLYLLHWRGSYPLAETVEAFERLRAAGKIRHWGVSNFDEAAMVNLDQVPHGLACASNQVLYNAAERGIEWELLPQSQERGLPIMAYSPLGQGEILHHPCLESLGRKHDVTTPAVALAFVLRRDGVIAIPKTSRLEHLAQNKAALEVTLDEEDLLALDQAFPPPIGPEPLAML